MRMDKLRRSRSDVTLDKNDNSVEKQTTPFQRQYSEVLSNGLGGPDPYGCRQGFQYLTHRQCGASKNGVETFSRGFKYQDSSADEDRFVHINEWYLQYGCNPCSRTETIYLHCYRSEEPVASNMDISTGHIVLVSTSFIISYLIS